MLELNVWSRRSAFEALWAKPFILEALKDLPEFDTAICPCCGFPTLAERNAFGWCLLCLWEDDGQDDPDADEITGGPNHQYSLSHARANFSKYLSMYSPDDQHCKKLSTATKTELIAEYTSLLGANNKVEAVAACLRINKLLKKLGQQATYPPD